MNEALAVYLDLDVKNVAENEVLIRKIDELLLTVGMKYSGIMNLYTSLDEQKRDQTVFRAEELLRNTDWLKNILSHISIGTITNACPLDEIQTAQRWLYIISFGTKVRCTGRDL